MDHNLAYSLLVPFDFTEKSLHALQYASDLIKKHDGMVHLLHVIDNRSETHEDTQAAIREKVTLYAREQQEKLGINIIPSVVSGNIFVSIGETARKLGVQLIVMGIHGMHGIQIIIGSFAARVILGSPVPVLLTNGESSFTSFKNIVLPFDLNVEMDHLIKKALELGRTYNSTIHLFSKNDETSFWRRKKANFKIGKTVKLIRKAGLNCQNVTLDAKKEDIAESVLKYAENIKADLIMATTQNQQNSKEYTIVDTGIRFLEKSKTPLYFINPPSM
jgi:nucleotide-binding universal stress UspA family protein